MLKEFKEFAMKGNVVDMAIGIIIGGAFGKIVSSLVSDVVMPPIGFILGGVDFNNLSIVLREATESSPVISINYGAFLNTVIDFLIIALAIFLILKQINRFMPKKAEATPTTKDCQFCCAPVSLKASKCPHCTSSF